MPYATLTNNGTSYPIIDIAVTETAMRGYEWNARLVGSANDIGSFSPDTTVSITLYDDTGTSMSFPAFITLQASSDPSGILDVSGMDRTTWKLSKDIDADAYDDADETSVYNSNSVHTMQAIVSEICSKCGVTLNYSGSTVYMYGLGTLTGTGISLLDRVLGLFNYEWRVANSGALKVTPLVWQATTGQTVPLLSASRHRDFEQRKTSMAFSKILSVPSYQDITVSNPSSTVTYTENLQNPNAVAGGGYPADRYIDPWTLAQVTISAPSARVYFNKAMELHGEYLYCELVELTDADGGWHIALYNGDPGTPDAPGPGTRVATLSAGLTTATASASKPFTHARLYHSVTWSPAAGSNVTVDEFPQVDGIKAVLRGYPIIPDFSQGSFTYVYESGKTPSNPDSNVVSDVLWRSKNQCVELAPGQMWADNRQSHTIDYSGPLVLGKHVADVISHHVFPAARIDQITYSLSSAGDCTTSMQCAVLGGAQW